MSGVPLVSSASASASPSSHPQEIPAPTPAVKKQQGGTFRARFGGFLGQKRAPGRGERACVVCHPELPLPGTSFAFGVLTPFPFCGHSPLLSSSSPGGFAFATLGYFVLLRGDVLEVTQNIEQSFVPAATVLQSQIGRLELRVAELEKRK